MKRYESLRASDADRDAVTERLREAAGEGRLAPDELEERVASALRARTYGELERLVADLPDAAPAPSRGRRGRSLQRPALVGTGIVAAALVAFAAVAVVAVLVVAAAAVAATWWVAVIVFWALCCRSRRRRAWSGAWRHSPRIGRV